LRHFITHLEFGYYLQVLHQIKRCKVKKSMYSSGMAEDLKIWGASNKAARQRCRCPFLICQNLGCATASTIHAEFTHVL
jgi:hypothetical protein